MMVGMGGWLCLGPAKIVQTIVAIPGKLRKLPNTVGKSSSKVPELYLEVSLRRASFLRPKKLYVEPQQITLLWALAPKESKLTPQQEREIAREEELAAKRQHDYDMKWFYSQPIRHMARGISQLTHSLFKAMRRTWTREGFMDITIEGQKYKLDMDGGWALDRGRALDRLVKVQQTW
jgi:hypothetical protein